MAPEGPVFTVEVDCLDCCKCVRHCPCKAIRIVNAKASVIPEACVACGECVKVCPAHAKMIRPDLPRLKGMLNSGARLYASIAPGYAAYFQNLSIGQLAAALKKIGFEGVSETAHGAEALSAETLEYLKTAGKRLVISSACPAAVDYIRKYRRLFASAILPLLSPVLTHCRILRERYGADIKTVFFGPCAAKKNESDRNPALLNLALTFPDLERFFEECGVNPETLSPLPPSALASGPAREGRFYSVEGGMNDTLRGGASNIRFLSVSGLENLARVLSGTEIFPGALPSGHTLFIEALACPGGCVNGPVMPRGSSSLAALIRTDAAAPLGSSAGKLPPVDIAGNLSFPDKEEKGKTPGEEEIREALARVEKYTRADELNCGACGYDSCREFARALLENKAEETMCLHYLRKNFERTGSALLRRIPAGVVFVDPALRITECNRNFADLTGARVEFDALGNLNTMRIEQLLPGFAGLFENVLSGGGAIERFNQTLGKKIVNISIFSIAGGKSAGAVIQDVTRSELRRERVAEKARTVIRKNVETVQQVAQIFGEHIADAEILLNELAGARDPPEEKTEKGLEPDGK